MGLTDLRQIAVDGLLLPPGSLIALLLLGLVLARRWPRLGHGLVWTAAVSAYLLCTPLVAVLLTRMTGAHTPFQAADASAAQAIVILAAEQREAPEYGGKTVGDMTLARLRLGAEIARTTHLPILVSGGRFEPEDPAMADMMADVLEREFGVSVRWREDLSRNTHENAEQSAARLREQGIDTVVLVTHYVHMTRARNEFAQFQIKTIPAPVHVPGSLAHWHWADLRPGFGALERSALALRELFALAVEPWR